MAIVRGSRPETGFYILSNQIANDGRLSLEAFGMLVYLLTRPDNWEVQESQLRKRFKIGRDKCKNILAELVESGYAEKRQKRDNIGSFSKNDWVISESSKPLTENPSTEKPVTVNPSLNKDLDLINTEFKQDLFKVDSDEPTREEKSDCPVDEIIELYHTVLPELPRVLKVTPARRQKIRHRWNEDSEHQKLEFWEELFQWVRECDFLMGRSKPWKADLDFITTQSKFVKIYEGFYHGMENNNQ